MADEHLKVVHDKDATDYNPTSVFEDLASLRKAQKTTISRKTALVNVKVGKPPDNVHFRAHPDWHLDDSAVLIDRDASTYYFVPPHLKTHPKLAPRLRLVTLAVIYLLPAGILQIWPVPLVEGIKKPHPTHKSARFAYEKSFENWVQITWSGEKQDYVVEISDNIKLDPVWPSDKTFNELLKVGFNDNILHETHDYVKQLQGIAT